MITQVRMRFGKWFVFIRACETFEFVRELGPYPVIELALEAESVLLLMPEYEKEQ